MNPMFILWSILMPSFNAFLSLFLPIIFIIMIILVSKASSSKDWEFKWETLIIVLVLFVDIIILTNISAYNDQIISDQSSSYMQPFNMWQVILWIYTPSIATIFGGIAYLNYKRKSGVDIRLQFLHLGGMTKESKTPQYIHEMQLHNYKDKPERIFAIYLLDKKNNYLKICSFPDSAPIVIKAFETVSIDLSAYIFTKEESDIYLFDQKTYKVVLSTSNGRYQVTTPLSVWEPKSYKQCKIRK